MTITHRDMKRRYESACGTLCCVSHRRFPDTLTSDFVDTSPATYGTKAHRRGVLAGHLSHTRQRATANPAGQPLLFLLGGAIATILPRPLQEDRRATSGFKKHRRAKGRKTESSTGSVKSRRRAAGVRKHNKSYKGVRRERFIKARTPIIKKKKKTKTKTKTKTNPNNNGVPASISTGSGACSS